jgi:putative transposase
MLIEPAHPDLSVTRQCELLGLPRASFYYPPVPPDPYDDLLMRRLDEQYTRTPFYGVDRMTVWLRQQGHQVGPGRVRRLLRKMGLVAIYPKPRTSQPNHEHRVYPYLLSGLLIDRPDQVWATDITYIRMRRGFVYLAVIMDWFSRFVVAWRLSVTLEVEFCLEALEEALASGRPEIFNSDQGAQYTSPRFTERLESAEVRISMDGKGRFRDNIFVERLWRTVKYEEVYLHDYENVWEAENRIGAYLAFYNGERTHQSLGYRTPEQVYRENTDKACRSWQP